MFLSAVSHFSHPVTEIPLPLFRVHEDELRALHEIGAKPLGPTFGDVVERVVAAGAVLLWYKPEGGRKLPAVLEAPEVDANMNQQSYCRLRSNAGNRHDALCIGIRCSHLFQPPLGFLLLLKKIEPNFTPALKRSHHVLRNKLGMLFKMCHHAGLNELRRFSDGTSELFESCVDLIAYLNAQLLKALILVLQKLQGLLLLTFNVDVRGTWYEVKLGDIGGVTQVILMIDIAKCLYVGPLRASEILCPWDNRSPPNGCIQ